jgi:NAD(P)-dependent dehydrogenase (short-subunit alcohol dehydrogenase family)
VDAPAVYPSLEGRRVLVTGGASGIGAEIVRGFARNRAQVAVVDIDREAGEAVAEELGVRFLACDLTDVAALRAAAADAGPVTVLINNAANDQRYAVEAITPEQWDAAQAVNLRHQFFMAQAVIPGMRAAGGGSIVNLSSVAWRRGPDGMLAYATAKAGVIGLTNALATALGGDGIRVNAIAPGWIRTPLTAGLQDDEARSEALLARTPLGRWGEPEDLVGPVLFLCSDAARFVTGTIPPVDGGYLAT